jgi:hypothetical protein
MADLVNSRREMVWRQRFRRFGKSRLTVAAFCRAEGVSAPSFYHWRKRLAERDRQEISAKRATESFVPVRLMTALAPPHAIPPVEIHLPNGVRVCVPGDDLIALRAGIAAAGELRGQAVASASVSHTREGSPC